MKKTIDIFSKIEVDLSCVGLIRDKSFPHHFCTPLNAVIFANLGVDGIHFCIIPDKNDRTLERSPIYVVSPMMPDHYVEAVAENFNDFISLVVSVKDAGALEWISYFEKECFVDHIQSIPNDNFEIENAVVALSNAFFGRDIDDVYDYVRQVQRKTDLAEIQYSEEYYEATGRI